MVQQKKRAYVYLAATSIFLVVLIVDAYRKAQIIADTMVHDMMKAGGMDAMALTQLFARLPATVAMQMKTLPSIFPAGVMTGITNGLVILWGLGMLDTYWQARRLKNKE